MEQEKKKQNAIIVFIVCNDAAFDPERGLKRWIAGGVNVTLSVDEFDSIEYKPRVRAFTIKASSYTAAVESEFIYGLDMFNLLNAAAVGDPPPDSSFGSQDVVQTLLTISNRNGKIRVGTKEGFSIFLKDVELL